MCGKGGGDTTQTTVTELPPAMQAAYNSLIGQAQGIYNSTSYTPFSGGTTNPTIQSGTQALQNAQTAYQPYFNAASSALTAAGTPAYQSVQSYENPYQSDVINATLAQMNQANQQQQQGVIGNAAMLGALGGDRVGVAQAQLAGQQALANNQVLAQLNNQNYAQALGAAQNQQQTQLNAANSYANMGNSASQNLTQSGMATTQAGEDQYNRDLAQYQAEQSYPFQKASWLGNITEGLGSTSGGTSTTTSNADTGSGASGIFGGILGLASLLPKSDERVKEGIEPIGKAFDGQTIYRYRYKGDPVTHVGLMAQEVEKRDPGAVHMVDGIRHLDYAEATDRAARKGHFAIGGVVPYGGIQSFGGTQNGNAGMASTGVVPAAAGGMGMGSGPRAVPMQSPVTGQPDALSKMSDTLQQKAMSRGLDNLQSDIQSIVNPPASVANMTTPTSAPEGTAPVGGNGVLGGIGNFMGSIGNFLHFNKGGVVRGYDDGGVIGQSQVFDPQIGWIPSDDIAGSDAALGAVSLAPVPASPDVAPSGSNASAGVVPAAPVPTTAAAPNAGVVAVAPPAIVPAAAPQGVVGAAASPPSGGVVPPMPPTQWVPAAPNVNSKASLEKDYGATGYGAINAPYRAPLDKPGEAGVLSPEQHYAYLKSQGATDQEALMLTGAAANESSFNPGAVHDGGNGYGLYGHNLQRLDMRGMNWQQQATAALNELRNSPQDAMVQAAKNPQQMALAEVAFERPRGYSADNPMGADNFTGRMNTLDYFGKLVGGDFNPDVTGSIGSSGAPATVPASNGVAGAQPDSGSGGILGRLFNGQGLTDNERLALLSAGLAIMGGKSRNPLINIGQGGLAGVQMYGTLQDRDRANALAQSEIATQKGTLGLEGKRVDLAAQELQMRADQFQKGYGLQVNQQNMDRYQRVPTMRGMMVIDRMNPQQPPQLISYTGSSPQGGILGQQPPSSSAGILPPAPTSGDQPNASAPVSGGTVAAAPASASSTVPATAPASVAAPTRPVVNPNRGGGPLSNAPPTQANAPPSAGILSRSAPAASPGAAPSASATTASASASPAPLPRISFQPPTPDASQIPMNGMAFNTEGQKALVDQTSEALKTARGEATAAQAMNQQLQEMQQDIQGLPSNGMLAMGSGFGTRTAFAKGVNSFMQSIHMDPIWDPDQVAKTEDLTKDSTRLGFDLSRMLGSREAGFITNQALAAVPGGANSVRGAQIIMASLQAANQRKVDYYNFIQDWSSKTGGDITGADAYFNKMAPPELYAMGAYVPARAMNALRQGQVTPAQFEQKYGAGTSQYVLGAQNG